MKNINVLKKIVETLSDAEHHLDYCGYGDSWERECAGNLSSEIAESLEAGVQLIKKYDLNYDTTKILGE